jgi:hypothetical protein
MFRSSTILRELVQGLAKVKILLKHSVKLRRCILCGDVAACREMTCVLFVVQTDSAQQTAHTSSQYIIRGAVESPTPKPQQSLRTDVFLSRLSPLADQPD